MAELSPELRIGSGNPPLFGVSVSMGYGRIVPLLDAMASAGVRLLDISLDPAAACGELAALRTEANARGIALMTQAVDSVVISALGTDVDVLGIGPEAMSNPHLLGIAGRSGSTVLLQRSRSSTVDEWLAAADVLAGAGNPRIVLCEGGIQASGASSDEIVDLAAVPTVRDRVGYPVIVRLMGRGGNFGPTQRSQARASVAAGAHGVILDGIDWADPATVARVKAVTGELSAISVAVQAATERSFGEAPVSHPGHTGRDSTAGVSATAEVLGDRR